VPAAAALIIAFILAIQGARLLYPPEYDGTGWLWFLGAAALAAFAFTSLQRREGEPLLPERPAPFASLGRMALGWLLVLAGLVLAVISVASLVRGHSHEQARWWWIGALALLIAGSAFVGALGPMTGARQAHSPGPDRRWLLFEIAGVALLVAVAIFLRGYRLTQMPPGVFVDETNAALDAIRLMEGRPDSPFATGWFETPTMYAFYLVGLFKVLGTSFVALKAASLIPAVLTVVAMYPLARLMFGIPTAFAATFILAVSRWHITMSRWGWNEVAPLLFMIVAVYFVQRAVRDRRASDFALGGLFLGLGHYTYLASRLVVLAVVLYLLYRVVFERGFAKRHWRGLVLAVVLYLVAFAPLAVTYVRNPFTFNNRSQQVSILNDMQAYYLQQRTPAPKIVGQAMRVVGLPKEISLLPLQESLLRHVEMFHAFGDRNPRHNLPGEPMVDPVTGALMMLGIGFALTQLFRPSASKNAAGGVVPGVSGGHRYALLLLWLVIPLLGGVLSRLDEAPQAYRTLPVVGAVALLAGDAAVRSARVLASALAGDRPREATRWLRAIPAVAIGLLLLWSATINYRLFFDVQAKDGRVWQAFSPVETAVAAEVSAKMADHSLYLSPRLYYFSPVEYFTYRSFKAGGGGLSTRPYHLSEPAFDLPLSDPFGQDASFLLDTYYQDVPELFQSYYPGTTFEEVAGPGGQPLYLSVTVPGGEITGLQGMMGAYVLGSDQAPVVQPYAGAPRFAWPPDLAARAGVQAGASWIGSLQIPASGTYDLVLDGPGRLLVDDETWSGPAFLGRGLHALVVEQAGSDSSAQLVLSWLEPGKDQAEPIPPNRFFTGQPPARGLKGEYFQGELWEGAPVFTRVDPLLLFAFPEAEPWAAPFSVRWTGTLTAPADGVYRLQLNADDGVRLWLDDDMVGESVIPDNVNLIDVELPLTAGPHAIRIDYFQRGGGKALEFWWQPPGDHLRPVPPAALTPQ
jgi:hypothetical protein